MKANLVLLLNFSFFFCFSQNTISGYVKDRDNKIISYANIFLKNTDEQTIVAFCHANNDGKYVLQTNKTGKFTLNFSAINYEISSQPIEILENENSMQINAILIYKPLELKEVIIETERPITIKKDTIIFNVKSFAEGNEKVVEDLLKKIPGLNVSSDGVIKVGNQEVEKVMIDGDDFFEKGYKLLTKNMPVNPIEKVELYQHYSNNKHLKGVENSEKVAINLKLKDDAKRQWFGNALLGYGLISENRYEVRSNVMNFGKKNKYYFLSNLNNIGDDTTGDINELIRPFSFDEISTIGENLSANSLLNLNTYSPTLKQKRVNFNNTEMLSLNSIFTLSPKTKLKFLGLFSSDENDFFRNSSQSFTFENTNFENTENFIGRISKITGFSKIDFTYDISKTKTLEYTGKFNSTNEKNRSDLTFNGDLMNEKLKSSNHLFDQKVVFTNKFKKNKVFLLSGRYINEKKPQTYSVNQFLYQDLFTQNASNVVQTSENKMQFTGFDAHLLDRKSNGDLLEIQFGNQFRKDYLLSHFQLKEDKNIIEEPRSYQNSLSYTSNDLYFNTKYRFKLKKISLLTQAEFHQLFNKLENFENKQTQNPFFINPRLSLEWEINKKNKVLTSYSLNKINATILDIYNNYIQTSFRSFSKGTGNFNQLNGSSVLLNYSYGNWGDKFFTNSLLMFTKNNDYFSTNTIISQNYSQSESIIIKDREYLTFSSNIDRYFKTVSSNLKLTFGGSKSNYKNIVNSSELRRIINSSLNYGVELRSGFKGFFNYHIGSKWNYNEIKTTIANSFTDNMTFLDLSFIMSDKFNFQIQTERYYFGNLDKQYNKYYFMDLEVHYSFMENKLNFSILGNNLFNTEFFRSYSINDISISKTEYKLQPRFILLKMEFRF
jgi:hypothetical protein